MSSIAEPGSKRFPDVSDARVTGDKHNDFIAMVPRFVRDIAVT
jgi:hypothetical protein